LLLLKGHLIGNESLQIVTTPLRNPPPHFMDFSFGVGVGYYEVRRHGHDEKIGAGSH
jgi:hypothetical protein